jgi:hypothetical protein
MARIVPDNRGARDFFSGMTKPREFTFSGAIAIHLAGPAGSCPGLVSGKATTLYRQMWVAPRAIKFSAEKCGPI